MCRRRWRTPLDHMATKRKAPRGTEHPCRDEGAEGRRPALEFNIGQVQAFGARVILVVIQGGFWHAHGAEGSRTAWPERGRKHRRLATFRPNSMSSPHNPARPLRTPEPRWPSLVALLAVGGLRLALPKPLSAGPSWLLLALIVVLSIPSVWAHRHGINRLSRILGFVMTSIVTVDMVWSLGLLIAALPSRQEPPLALLESAATLWIVNILVFASWYWRLDAGGPIARELRGVHTDGAFLFPQMVLDAKAKAAMGEENWSPGFVDYLFLAFNTSTALSPTDVPVLSRWAKGLMMLQSLISLATIALLAARAVNIL